MHRREDVVFTAAVRGEPGYDAPVLLHCHPGVADQKLIIFLHGLGGRRYETWGDLPGYLFGDCPDTSLALYDYPSGVRAVRPRSGVDLRDLAREIADFVRDATFTRVVMVGHSMGGLLAKAVVKDLLDSGARCADGVPAVQRVAGLVLMATPQAGSLRVPGMIATLTRDGRALRAHSRFVSDLTDTFRNKIDTTGRRPADPVRDVSIPTFGVVGLRDAWVDRLSSSLDLARNQIKHVRATHTSIVKPKSQQDDAYAWLLAKVQECLATSYAGDVGQQLDERVMRANRWSPPPRRRRLTVDSQQQLVWIDDLGAKEDLA